MSWNSIPKVPLVALIACLLLGLLGDVVLAQTGRVVDADSGQPLRGVEVRVATRAPVHTDADGRFSLVVPSATRVVLNVSTIGYALARRTVNENEAGSDLLIPLVAGTGTYTERVSVSAKGGEAATPGVRCGA